MLSSNEIAHYIGQIWALNGWVNSVPNTDEFRNATTIRQFAEMKMAKRLELGLTPEVFDQLIEIEGNADLDRALLELGMTLDSKELAGPSYFEDLPLNYYDMPEYQTAINAVDEFMARQPFNIGVSDDVLAEVVRDHLSNKKQVGG